MWSIIKKSPPYLLIVLGIIILLLAVYVPGEYERLRVRSGGSVTVTFTPGPTSKEVALMALLTSFSIFAVLSTISLSKAGKGENVNYVVRFLSSVSIILLLVGICYVTYLLLLRPLTGGEPTLEGGYLSIRLFFAGLGFFTISLGAYLLPTHTSTG